MTIDASTDPTPLTPPSANITGGTDRDIAGIGVRLLDDAYIAWMAAESEAEQALAAWLEPTTSSRASAYPAYRAALDREEAAARDLRRLCELTAPCMALLKSAIVRTGA